MPSLILQHMTELWNVDENALFFTAVTARVSRVCHANILRGGGFFFFFFFGGGFCYDPTRNKKRKCKNIRI